MATLPELEAALRRAHAAGNTEHAKRFADAIRQMRGQKPQKSLAERYAAAGIDPNEYSATEGMSGGEKFMAGVGKSMHDTYRGVRQLFGGLSREEVDEQRRIDAPLMDTGAGVAGNIAGTVGQFLVPGGALKGAAMGVRSAQGSRALNAGARALLPSTARGAAAQGGVIGATQPLGEGESRMGKAAIGVGAGWAGAQIPHAVGGLARLMRSGVTRKGADRRIAEILRAEASNPDALMASAPSQVQAVGVPGVQRTLAEESLDPGIARLERLMRSKTKGWNELDSRNNAARVSVLREIGGDDGAIRAAEANRDAMAEPFLRAAKKHVGVDTSRLAAQLERAQEMYSGRPAVQTTLRDVADLLYRPATAAEKRASPNWPDQVLRDEVGQLYNVRKTLGDLMSGKLAGEKPAAAAATRELMMVRNGLDRAIGKETPMFRGYLEAYKQGSRDVDRRKLGQYLLDKGAGGAVLDAATGQPTLTPAAFSRLANNMDAAAANATGFRKARAENIFEPEDFGAVNAIKDDLERRAFANTAGSGGGSPTFERFAGEGRLRSRFMQAIPLVRDAAALLDDAAKARLERSLAEVLQDPSKARAILARLPAQERRVVENALSFAGGTLGGSAPAVAE